MPKGKIVKALSGFYYVQYEGGLVQCRGRGNFRQKKITPLVGDYVEFEYHNKKEGYILAIAERENQLTRPPIANVDQAIIVTSVKEPDLSLNLLDKFLVLVESKSIQPLLFFTKMDLLEEEEESNVRQKLAYYQTIGYEVEFLSTKDRELNHQLSVHLNHKVSVFAGQSGVGKTSLLNKIIPDLQLETDDISESLGRGKHTTRHVELITFEEGLIADTPGFSALDFKEIKLEVLPECFPEFVELQNQCKFRGCMHIKEPKCAVKAALDKGEILDDRYQNYLQFVEEIKNRKPRY
ncbi:ribosome small subunit-dependent GTPase A [Gracilibacillus caseinilyticus]|uniref:Small ribosomal subunit biogenesis GTPase RsgA n=1 Tax=Gracilibacillus caseinilyticus TaxID=2932256 RepID=A0ABY4EU23_9BACI|nr:ribosome small subunit-dependent GTPase A [Gracilibacillus caseinilyticus]UOQ47919.1 ribosome small subunit-dependent GTPase A [Gracilibacillus caseinilyticus]